MQKMYQFKNKEAFLNQATTLKNNYIWLFSKSAEFEYKYSRDLFDFSKKQILEFLSSRDMSVSSLNIYLNNIKKYIDFAIDSKIKFENHNPATEVTKEDIIKIGSEKPDVIEHAYIDEIIGKEDSNFFTPPLQNVQDQLMIYLIFLGISGKQMSDLRNLKYEHIDFDNNIIKLSEINPNRLDIRVDEYCMDLLRVNKRVSTYRRYIDDDKNPAIHIEDQKLLDNGYVMKKVEIGNYDPSKPMSQQGIMNRLRSISSYLGESITSKRLEESGMVYFGKKLIDSGYELNIHNEIVEKALFERYGIDKDSRKYKVIKMIKKEVKDSLEFEV